MALARFSLTGVSDVSVHGLPAVMGGVDQLFGGVVVVWEEGGRLVAVVTTAGVDDALARAESVKVIDEVAWADLIQEATNNVGGSDGQPTESWLIAAGEFDDSATWVIEGSVDDRGKFTACTNTFSVNSSSSGCGSASEVAVPSVVTIGGVGGDGVRGVGFVGFVDDAVAGVVLRFTATDGTIAEAPLRTVRPDWAFQAAGVVAVQGGVVELVAADGSVLVSQAVDQGDLDAVGSGSNVTSATTAPAAPAG